MFNGLLRACMTKSYDGSLTSNSKGSIKCVSLNNQLRPARPTLVILTIMNLFIIHLQ